VPRLCELYSGICLTTEEKARKTSVRVADGEEDDEIGENMIIMETRIKETD
jgi:hypothetical protein